MPFCLSLALWCLAVVGGPSHTAVPPPGFAQAESQTSKQPVSFAALLFYEEALALFRSGRAAEGQAKLKQALAEEPRYFDALYRMAEELNKQNDVLQALQYLERARSVNNQDARVYRLLGLMMMAQNNFPIAAASWREVLRLEPNSANANQGLGTALLAMALNEPDTAKREALFHDAQEQLLTSLKRSNGKLLLSHFQLARLHEARGNKQLAQAELDALMRQNPAANQNKAVRDLQLRLQNSSPNTSPAKPRQ